MSRPTTTGASHAIAMNGMSHDGMSSLMSPTPNALSPRKRNDAAATAHAAIRSPLIQDIVRLSASDRNRCWHRDALPGSHRGDLRSAADVLHGRPS